MVRNMLMAAIDGLLDLAGKNLYTFGDSITEGYYSTPSNNSGYTTDLAALSGMIEHNFGIAGSIILKRSPIDPLLGGTNMIDQLPDVPVYNADTDGLLSLAFGMNDAGYNSANYTTANFKTDYNTVLTEILGAKGWPRRRVTICTLPYPADAAFAFYQANFSVLPNRARFDNFHQATIEVCDEWNIRCVDLYTATRDSPAYITDLDADGIHPHDIGQAFIAQTIYDAITS